MKPTIILLIFLFVSFTFGEEERGGEGVATNALAQAITSSNWSWEHAAGGTRKVEQVQFYHGGFTENPKNWTARWKVVGPRILEVENTRRGSRQFGNKALLVFDAAYTQFIGFDFNGRTTVNGFRREALDPAREPPK